MMLMPPCPLRSSFAVCLEYKGAKYTSNILKHEVANAVRCVYVCVLGDEIGPSTRSSKQHG